MAASYIPTVEPYHVDSPKSWGGPIAGLIVALPISLLLWGALFALGLLLLAGQ